VVLLVCGIFGASNFILIKALVGKIAPEQLVTARVLIAAVTLSAVLLAAGKMPKLDRPTLKAASILAVIDAIIPYMLIVLAAPHILASTSGLLASTMPLFTAVIVSTADRRRIGASTALGIAFGALGVSILAGPSALNFGSSTILAMVAVLVAACCYGASAVYSRIPLQTANPVELSVVKFWIAGVALVVATMFVGKPVTTLNLDLPAWLALFSIGFLVTGLARCGYVWVISAAGSVTASLLTYVIPAATLGFAWVFLGEILTLSEWLGALLVGVSVTCVLFGTAIAAAFRRRWLSPASRSPLAEPEQATG
jgi:drug/metabolite transporter (DMT)-like permease